MLNKPNWVDDSRFKTGAARSVNATERITLVGEILGTRTSEHWLPLLDDAEVPCAPVLRRQEVVDNVQVRHNEIIKEFDQPFVGRVRQARPAARFDNRPAAIGGPARRLGEDTQVILQELGYSSEQIDALEAHGTVMRPKPV